MFYNPWLSTVWRWVLNIVKTLVRYTLKYKYSKLKLQDLARRSEPSNCGSSKLEQYCLEPFIPALKTRFEFSTNITHSALWHRCATKWLGALAWPWKVFSPVPFFPVVVRIHLSPRRGSVDVCLHWSPHSFVSQSGWLRLALRMPPLPSFVSRGWWCPALRMSVFTCSRRLFGCGWWCPAFRVSVFTCRPSSVSPSGWWCPALWMSMFNWLPSFILVWLVVSGSPDCPPSSVSRSGWRCPALRMSVFSCLPSCASLFGWWCPALWMSVFNCPPSFASQSGWSARLCGCLSSVVFSPNSSLLRFPILLNMYQALSTWRCPAVPMSPINLSPHVAIHLVSSSRCLQFICPPLVAIHLFPSLVVPGFPDVSNSFVSPSSNAYDHLSKIVV